MLGNILTLLDFLPQGIVLPFWRTLYCTVLYVYGFFFWFIGWTGDAASAFVFVLIVVSKPQPNELVAAPLVWAPIKEDG